MEGKGMVLFLVGGFVFLLIVGIFQGSVSGEATRTRMSCTEDIEDGQRIVTIFAGERAVTSRIDRCINDGRQALKFECTTDAYGKYIIQSKTTWCDFGEICFSKGVCEPDPEVNSLFRSRRGYGLLIP